MAITSLRFSLICSRMLMRCRRHDDEVFTKPTDMSRHMEGALGQKTQHFDMVRRDITCVVRY